MKAKEFRDLSIPEIEKKLREVRDELTMLRMKKQLGQVEKPHLFNELRRDIARMVDKFTLFNRGKRPAPQRFTKLCDQRLHTIRCAHLSVQAFKRLIGLDLNLSQLRN